VAAAPNERPIRLVVREDDLRRSRLTIFFRLLLALPVLVWLVLWGIAAFVVAIILWFAILFRGSAPATLHEFVAGYLRYWSHATAYVLLAADPYPWFRGSREYPVDLEIDAPTHQSRWKTLFRLFLALPAILLATALGGTPGGGGWQFNASKDSEYGGGGWGIWASAGGVAAVCAFLAWFASLARGREPRGLRDLTAYALNYSAQMSGYLLLLTDRYPTSDPSVARPFAQLPEHPVRIVVNDELERSRLTVFFRLLLAIPHLVWLMLWTAVVFFAVVAAWLVALVIGRVPSALHRFIAAYVRYSTHLGAYLTIVGRRFPGFVGRRGSYGVDLEIDQPGAQNRWKTLFRLFLAIPAFFVSSALSGALFIVAFLGWWYALFTGRMPEGLRNLGVSCLRYEAQTWSYLFLLTSRYPFASPVLEGGPAPEPAPSLEPPAFEPPAPLPQEP
jgi:hypothetical protein